jgi:hypothetical protein
MTLASAILSLALPLALDGESVSGNNEAIAVVSVVSIAFGYLLLAGLWYFVFSAKAQERREAQRRETHEQRRKDFPSD